LLSSLLCNDLGNIAELRREADRSTIRTFREWRTAAVNDDEY